MSVPSRYEQRQLKKIHKWKDPRIGLFGRVANVINWPMDKAADYISKIPGVDQAVDRTVGSLIRIVNDAAHWSVRTDAIYREYREEGHNVKGAEDIFKLDLKKVDKTIGRLAAKYEVLAAGEGVTTGMTGIIGIPADVVGLAALNLRAIGEYATYCGFDVSQPEERVFAMSILDLASSPNERAKKKALSKLVKIAQDVAARTATKGAQKSAMGALVDSIAKNLGVRLTYDKVAEIIPVAGAVVGGITNATYTARVCEAANNLYRERFLAHKYGPHMIDVTVEPAEIGVHE